MTILNYSVLNSPSGPQAIMNLIRTFAVAQGWVQDEWRPDESWDATTPFGWISNTGNADWLQLTSTGYGSQNLIVALDRQYSGIQMSMRTQTSYSTIDTRPVLQNPLMRTIYGGDWRFQSNPTEYDCDWGWQLDEGSMDKAWVFGNEKFILCVVSIDGLYYTHMFFGSLEIWEDNPTQGEFYGYQAIAEAYNYRYRTAWTWHSGATYFAPAFSPRRQYFGATGSTLYHYTTHIYYDNREITSSTIGSTVAYYMKQTIRKGYMIPQYYNPFQGDANRGYGQDVLTYNGYSGRRPLLKDVHFYVRQSDSVICPLGTSWVYFFDNTGVEPGSTLTYGTKQFIVFPIKTYADSCGFAVRIA